MHDPFPISPIPWLSEAVQPLADYLHLTTMPLHIHEVLLSFLAYSFVQVVIAPKASTWLFPERYAALSREKRINWNVHVVSLVQSVLINTLALWVLFVDKERKNMNWQERVWGYTGAAGMIQALAAGYFLWDLIISVIHVKVFGVGMLIHAISALMVFSFGFVSTLFQTVELIAYTKQRPFVNFYGCTFILYELSSPFLNFHWFCDKLNLSGSKTQLYNGIVLLFTFFCCRLVWGTYQSLHVLQDIWAAINHDHQSNSLNFGHTTSDTAVNHDLLSKHSSPLDYQLMRFSEDQYVPIWLSLIYLGSNLILNFLNFFWFRQMIKTIRKRFRPEVNLKKSSPAADEITKHHTEDINLRRRILVSKANEPETIKSVN
ncbi:putative TLC domain-containing protein C17A2.02c [Golovinomyces cichoracearum]|uniref:Putative TLC domain-containing protein C17A2.02c n=1 Tax=Golovinomyces cichoracearum TaxID=62708 RepID=A0A420J8S1_9PEZI|nr:putative TLC domain-containing protein C17A2.02c [Golovinomyces cichoracearum]